MGEKRKMYSLLERKAEGKRPLGRTRRRWIDNTKMDLLGMGLGGVAWTGFSRLSTGGELL
jgi:hypothetical protein